MCCTIISKFKVNIFLHSAGPRLLSLAFDACKIVIFFDECASFLVQIVPLLCNILCYIASLSHCLLEGFTVSIFHIRDKDKNTPIVACHNGRNFEKNCNLLIFFEIIMKCTIFLLIFFAFIGQNKTQKWTTLLCLVLSYKVPIHVKEM